MEVPNEKIMEMYNQLLQMSIASQRYSEAVENLLLQMQPYTSAIHNERMLSSQKKIKELESKNRL